MAYYFHEKNASSSTTTTTSTTGTTSAGTGTQDTGGQNWYDTSAAENQLATDLENWLSSQASTAPTQPSPQLLDGPEIPATPLSVAAPTGTITTVEPNPPGPAIVSPPPLPPTGPTPEPTIGTVNPSTGTTLISHGTGSVKPGSTTLKPGFGL